MLDNQAKARKPSSWRSKPILSIRARLLVLALLAIAPLVFDRVHGLEVARGHRVDRARAEVIELARRGTESQREIIYSVRALLQIVARAYAKLPLEAANCNQYLTALTGNVPWIRGLSVAGADGRITCSTESDVVGLNVSDRPHFQNALHSRDFALSDYLVNRVHQWPSLIATFPVIGDDDAVDGVVLAVINLQWVGELVSTAMQRSGASVLLLDGGGTLVAGSADQENLIGKPFAAQSLAHDMLTRDEGTVTTEGFDGVRRIFAYARVPWTQARLAVGLDERAVQAGIDREIDCRLPAARAVQHLRSAGGVVRRRAAHRQADPLPGAHRNAHRTRRLSCAHDAGELDRRVQAACLGARRHGEEARRTRGGVAHRQRAPR